MGVREIRCPECGATRKATDRTIALVCEYCGAFIGVDESMDSRVEAARRAVDLARNPTEASRRFNEVAGEMTSAAGAGDRERWRTVAREYYSLQAILYPDSVPADDRESVRLWVNEAVAMGDLNNFDPAIKPAFDEYTRGFTELYSAADPVSEAGRLLERCTAYNRIMQEHPDCPPSMTGRDPRRLAITSIKASLVGMTGVLGPEAVARIRSEVLGLVEGSSDSCPECGAPLEEAGDGRCPYCGSRLDVEASDPWLHEQLALFEQVKASSPSFPPVAAINTALGFVLMTLQRDPSFPADRAARFLEQAVPEASPPTILQHARQLLAGRTDFLGSLEEALSSRTPG